MQREATCCCLMWWFVAGRDGAARWSERAAGVKYDGLMSPVAPHGPAAGKI